jgi:hypothetical protein
VGFTSGQASHQQDLQSPAAWQLVQALDGIQTSSPCSGAGSSRIVQLIWTSSVSELLAHGTWMHAQSSRAADRSERPSRSKVFNLMRFVCVDSVSDEIGHLAAARHAWLSGVCQSEATEPVTNPDPAAPS